MKVVYVGDICSISNQAGFLRVVGIAKAIALGGYDVHIASKENNLLSFAFDSPYIHLHIFEKKVKPNKLLLNRLIGAHKERLKLVDWLYNVKPDVIICFGTNFGNLRCLLKFSKRMNTPLILDVVEWYDGSHFPGGKFGFRNAIYTYSMRHLASKAHGVIAISDYLKKYFQSNNVHTIKIPPLFYGDLRPDQFREKDQCLHLCYAGTPGKKDSLFLMIKSIKKCADIVLRKICFHIVGLTNDDLAQIMNSNGLASYESGHAEIICYGRVDNAKAREIIAACDFTILLRDEKRYSKAGFPSKIAESLTLGTPVITNLTSDLKDILRDGDNSIIVLEANEAALSDAIFKAMLLDMPSLQKLKLKTKNSSADFFDFHRYAPLLESFIERIKMSHNKTSLLSL